MRRVHILMWVALLLGGSAANALAGRGIRPANAKVTVMIQESPGLKSHRRYSITHGPSDWVFLVPTSADPALADRLPGVFAAREQVLDDALSSLREQAALILSVEHKAARLRQYTRFLPRFQSTEVITRNLPAAQASSHEMDTLLTAARLQHWWSLDPPAFAHLGYYSAREWLEDRNTPAAQSTDGRPGAWWHLQVIGPRTPREIEAVDTDDMVLARQRKAVALVQVATMLPLIPPVERTLLAAMDPEVWRAIRAAGTDREKNALLAAHLARHGGGGYEKHWLQSLRELAQLARFSGGGLERLQTFREMEVPEVGKVLDEMPGKVWAEIARRGIDTDDDARNIRLAEYLARQGVGGYDQAWLSSLREFVQLVHRFQIPLDRLEGIRMTSGELNIPQFPPLHEGLVVLSETRRPRLQRPAADAVPSDAAGATDATETRRWYLELTDPPRLQLVAASERTISRPGGSQLLRSAEVGDRTIAVQHTARPEEKLHLLDQPAVAGSRDEILSALDRFLRSGDNRQLVAWFRDLITG
jgi:hypothetical protein